MSDNFHPNPKDLYRFDLGRHQERIEKRLNSWKARGFLHRLWKKDPYIWSKVPVPEIEDRLGWLFLPELMEERLAVFLENAEELKREDITRVVLIGMGGSSLAPEVFQSVFGSARGCPELVVLDSTHPGAISRLQRTLDLERTLFLISSKSGTTLETLSLFKYFWDLAGRSSASPGQHFAAVTDSGTPLEKTAQERKFRFVYRSMPDVGGRYSAFTEFGLVPAAFIGVDIRTLLSRAKQAVRANSSPEAADRAPGLHIAAVLGELNPERDKASLLASPSLSGFPEWLEQLIAESTGKDGRGILPVVNDPLEFSSANTDDRIIISHRLGKESRLQRLASSSAPKGYPVIECIYRDTYDIGFDIFTWEVAVSAASSILGVHPFNQPDVQRSKELARKAMAGNEAADGSAEEGFSVDSTEDLTRSLGNFLAKTERRDYISLQAYLEPAQEVKAALEGIRRELSVMTGAATTFGFGPRYLHSCGQLHKGGPNTGRFIQLVDRPEEDLPVPETDFTFKRLLEAQARGDCQALEQSGKPVFRVSLGEEPLRGLDVLERLVKRL